MRFLNGRSVIIRAFARWPCGVGRHFISAIRLIIGGPVMRTVAPTTAAAAATAFACLSTFACLGAFPWLGI
jgi:hypothetical protein